MTASISYLLPMALNIDPRYFSEAERHAIGTLIAALNSDGKLFNDCFVIESLIIFAKHLPFTNDLSFVRSALTNASVNGDGQTLQPSTILRLYNTVLCARAAIPATPADAAIIEVGCLLGDRIATVMDAVDGAAARPVYLYDLFENDGSHLGYSEHIGDSYAATLARFAPRTNVKVIKGFAPKVVLDDCPDKIALAIIDTGIPDVDAGTASAIIDRLVPGGYLYFNVAYFSMSYSGVADRVQELLFTRNDFSPLFWSPAGDAWAYRLLCRNLED